ncbi:dual specificity protein phosphatase family protein [Shinella sp. NM-101]|uniref:dual specificity protein phosphatase family protein n=1 Tax=Shinella sp. NM-101 TaxID=2744455 RepID=UPI001ACAD3D6|nr:dual specificity protein phosphatase family protein [Shinella sp. NM-101]MBN9056220.1 dual specificity protein phosphatase family protein [Hyphomicrobiales bacterium]
MTIYRKAIGKKVLKRAAAVLAICAVAGGGYLGFLQLTGNFHTVIAGEFYRSAQPTPKQLEKYVADHGIKTIINLRGADSARWYRDEVATAKALGVQHIDFKMSSSDPVTGEVADQLIAIMRNAPKPILIHCKAGADRSGIVSAIYSRGIAGWNEESAERQLSVYFGHIGIPYLSSTYALDESWEKLEHHLDQQG